MAQGACRCHAAALITGASSGIGEATARRLANAGLRVGLCARRRGHLDRLSADIEAGGGQALALDMDVTDMRSVTRAVAAFHEWAGSIDVLVNNAGLMPMSDIAKLRVDEARQTVDVNVHGVLNVTGAVLPHMLAQGSGHIINMSSIAGRKVLPGLAVYSATKHAVTAFSEGLRMELGRRFGLRVTCIQPGAVATELHAHTSSPEAKQKLDEFRKQVRQLESRDIAESVLFAVRAPAHVDVAELFVLPTDQEG